MDKFLETRNIPKLNQEEAENLHTQITPTEIEATITNSQQTKALDQMASQENFTKHSVLGTTLPGFRSCNPHG